MSKLLAKPYPFLFFLKRNLIIAILVGIFIGVLFFTLSDKEFTQQYLFLTITQKSFFYGLITFFSIILIFDLFPRSFISDTQKENWTISKQLGLISLLHFTIVIFNYIFIIFISKDTSIFLSIKFFLGLTFSVVIIGLIPSFIIVWIDYTIKLKENLKQTKLHNQKLQETLKNKKKYDQREIINIPSDNQNEIINFDLRQLLFIKSDGNYIDIYLKENEEIVKMLHRASIQTIENYLSEFSYIIRTHRSYLVNIQNIKSSKGNARNYQLYFEKTEISVPVSRSRFQKFNEAMNS